jgi:hypothetical protein
MKVKMPDWIVKRLGKTYLMPVKKRVVLFGKKGMSKRL